MKYATVILVIAGMALAVAEPVIADPWAGAATIRDETFYVPSSDLTLGGLTTIHTGTAYELSGYAIANVFQINLEYQAGVLDSDIANLNTYLYPANAAFPPGHTDGTWSKNFGDPEEYIFNINPLLTGLTVYTYPAGTVGSGYNEVFDADIDWTITGWHQTILAGDIVGNMLRVLPVGTYRPFENDVPVNNVEIFDGNVATEVLGYTFEDAAGDIGSGDTLGVQTVPVPGAVLLGAMGLGMVGWMKRRKKEA